MTFFAVFVLLLAPGLLLHVSALPFIPPTAAPEILDGPTFTVNLSRQKVPVIAKGRTVAYKTAYFGSVSVGHPRPQNFTVVFDTGSAHFLLPSAACEEQACLTHRRFDRTLSESAVDIDHDGNKVQRGDPDRDQVSINYGTGSIMGDFIDESVCVGFPGSPEVKEAELGANCVRARLITATKMSNEPFAQFEFDGVLGLGLEALALHPEFNILGQMTRRGRISPVFGVSLASGEEQSEITFGGHNAKRVNGPFFWTDVTSPEKGYWQVRITGVRVGSQELDVCDDEMCVGIVDTGTSLLGVPKDKQQQFHLRMARRMPEGMADDVDCRAVPGPKLTIDIGDFSVHLEAADYTRPAAMQVKSAGKETPESICRASLLPVDMPALGPRVFLLGEPVLRKYYTMYDSRRARVGFAVAAAPDTATAEDDEKAKEPPRWDVEEKPTRALRGIAV